VTWAQAALCWLVALVLGVLVYASMPDDGRRPTPLPGAGPVAAGPAEADEDGRAPAKARTATAETEPAYVLDAARLERVEVRRGDAVVRLERVGEGWKAVAPTDRVILPGLVSAFVAQLVDSGHGARIGDDAGDPAFGLDAPQLTIDASGGGERLRLVIGARAPTGTAAYALVAGEGRVVLVGLSLLYYADLLFE